MVSTICSIINFRNGIIISFRDLLAENYPWPPNALLRAARALYPCNKPLGWYVRLYRRPFVPIASCCLTVGIIIAVVVINGGNRAQSATMISHDKHTKHVPFDETGEARPERPSRPFAISIRRPYHSGKRGEAPRKRLSRPFVIGIRSLYHSMKCNIEPWVALPYSKNNREIVNMARRQARKFWGLRPLKRL